MTAEDRSYLIRTWVMALRTEGHWSSIGKTIEMLVDGSQDSRAPGMVEITVACLTETPEVIVGYCAYRAGTLLLLSVRDKWRPIGDIDRALFEAARGHT